MGIPAYFSYILKQHRGILQKLGVHRRQLNTVWDVLLMDCNSIIYDVVHAQREEDKKKEREENKEKVKVNGWSNHENIIDLVIAKIRGYIAEIRPTRFTMVAFDGVAPMAKMEQQRLRRFKGVTCVTTGVTGVISEGASDFNTVQITPGTPFMALLAEKMEAAFAGDASVIVATSTGPGEGEQKLFAHLRANPQTGNVAVYGLDADLIMLALFHLDYARNIFVCREEPQRDNDKNKNQNQTSKEEGAADLIFLDAAALSRTLCAEMAASGIEEYAFLCFFLGNDFLPHFPALNLRTTGLNRLMEAYRTTISAHPGRRLVTKTKTLNHDRKHYSDSSASSASASSIDYSIEWKNVTELVAELARHEPEFLRQEMEVRETWEAAERRRLETQGSGIDAWRESAPILFRGAEHYIFGQGSYGIYGCGGSFSIGWRERYYRALFPRASCIKKDPWRIAENYAEGLNWVLQYYTRGCIDTRWKYRHAYPPLLGDLTAGLRLGLGQVPKVGCQTFVSPREQLLYVVPPAYYSIVGLGDELEEDYEKNNQVPKYQWAFCRFLWEAHLEFED
jgi:5'-3' exonuclease